MSWWIPRATIRRLLRAFMEHLDVDVPDDVLAKAIDDFIEGRTAVTTDRGGQSVEQLAAAAGLSNSEAAAAGLSNSEHGQLRILKAVHDNPKLTGTWRKAECDRLAELGYAERQLGLTHITAAGIAAVEALDAEQLADVVFMLPERETSIEQLAADTTVTVDVDGAQVEVEGTIEQRLEEPKPPAKYNPLGGASRGVGRCTCPCGKGTDPGCPVHP